MPQVWSLTCRSGAGPTMPAEAHCVGFTGKRNPISKPSESNVPAARYLTLPWICGASRLLGVSGMPLNCPLKIVISFIFQKVFAHGFQTLIDDTELLYHISEPFRPEYARGVRWNDPALAIGWPAVEERILSDRDTALPFIDKLDADP